MQLHDICYLIQLNKLTVNGKGFQVVETLAVKTKLSVLKCVRDYDLVQ